MATDKSIAYSEIFHSLQGEGHYTGRPTAWLRFFLCNLQCDGFGQADPTDKASYILPYQTIDIGNIKRLEDLPVFKYGCDSSYSWSAKFKHLQHKHTASQIADRIRESMYHPKFNPEGLFNHNNSRQHLCFTGGEPLMKHAQMAAIKVYDVLMEQGDYPLFLTWETNGTQKLTSEFSSYFDQGEHPAEVFFSVSPKLFSVTGEVAKDAIDPYNVAEYFRMSSKGQLKFVVNGTNQAWDELEETVDKFRSAGVMYPIWIMNAGATLEGQKGTEKNYVGEAHVATESFKRGYNYSSRVHVHIYGNQIGT